MTKFFMKWWVDAKIPDTPQEAAKRILKMLEAVKDGLNAGRFTEWGQFSNGSEGYAISELSESEIFAIMLKFRPVIAYTLVPVLDVDQSMEAVKKAAAAMQA